MKHLKPLYAKGHLNRTPIYRTLTDGRAIVYLVPYSMFKKLGKSNDELIKINMTLTFKEKEINMTLYDVGGDQSLGSRGAIYGTHYWEQDTTYNFLHRRGTR